MPLVPPTCPAFLFATYLSEVHWNHRVNPRGRPWLMFAQGQAPAAVSVLWWPPSPPGSSHRMLLAGQGEPHQDHITWIQLLPSTHTMLPSLQSQQEEELAPTHLSLPTFAIPHHSWTQGRWGFGLTLPRSHPLQPHQWNTGKYKSTQNIGLKPRKYYSVPQIHLSYCLDGVYYEGAVTLWNLWATDSPHPSQKHREQLTPPYSWSSSLLLLASSIPLSFFILLLQK